MTKLWRAASPPEAIPWYLASPSSCCAALVGSNGSARVASVYFRTLSSCRPSPNFRVDIVHLFLAWVLSTSHLTGRRRQPWVGLLPLFLLLPSMEVVNRYVATRHHIEGAPTEDDFEVKEETLRWAPDSGEVLVRNLYLSIDPYQLNRMKRSSASHHAVDGILPGQRIASYAAGEVVASACEEYAAGDVVAGVLGWEDYTLFKPSPAVLMSKVAGADDADAEGFPLSHHISVLGTSGMTAYGGLFEVGKPVKGEKVFVSAASGSVGSLVGQFAKLAGCYVVGCAGTKAKVDLLKDKLGFDDAFNYKEEPDLKSALKRYFPDGIDIYFENVGGEMLEAALANMNTYGRVALSGAISEYTGGGRRAVPDLLEVIYKRITIRGFFAWDFLPRFAEFNAVIAGWIRDGKVQVVEDVSDGLESVPSAFAALFTGQNVGKKLVKLA